MSQRNLLLLLATAVISYACYVRAEQNPYARYVAAGYSVIDRWSLMETPDQELFNGAMQGMVGVLKQQGDEFSGFVTEKNRAEFREDMRQEFGGLGVQFDLLGDPQLPTLTSRPLPSTPAFKSKLQAGDRILRIDRQPTLDLSISKIFEKIRGPVGTTIVLTIERKSEAKPFDVSITRQVIHVESILGERRSENGNWIYRLVNAPQFGYIRIDKFGDKTIDELTPILAELCGQPDPEECVDALILDVRDNSGGGLDVAVDISDLFLPAGLPIVTTRGRDQVTRDRFVSTGRSGYTKIPIAVLINHNSASASEILAACLQDHRRAVIVGQRSFGKGTVQDIIPVESGRSILKLTSATYWRPNGQNIHRMQGDTVEDPWGVEPNPGLRIVLDEKEYDLWKRHQLRRDLMGDTRNTELAKQLDEKYGILPEIFRDRVLEKAIEVLKK